MEATPLFAAPNSETVQLTYGADGLLASLSDPRNNTSQFMYDAQGKLLKDTDAAGGFKALARTDQSTGWTIALSTALTRTTTYQTELLPVGDQRLTNTEPSGLVTTTLIKPNSTTTTRRRMGRSPRRSRDLIPALACRRRF